MSPSNHLHHGTTQDFARQFVATYFDALERHDLAALVLAGEGDDFPEFRAALRVLGAHWETIARYGLALSQYADTSFWDEATPGGPLAMHDGGEMARNVISGRPPFFHRD